jgi:tRNA pseudouridine38-40 synthase
MTVAYDGTGFHGFATNEGVATVQGALQDALGKVLRVPVAVTGAGRTDAGVHAWGQVVSFDAPEGVDLARLERSVNGLCGPAIVVRAAALAAPDFDARFSARWRRYRYTVLNTPAPSPFLTRTAWHVATPLDLDELRLACDPVIGEHDFSSFCRRPKGDTEASMVRRVLSAEWRDVGDGVLRFEITATAFCHQMVRSIVGTHVEIGSGRRTAGELLGVLRSRRRAAAGPVAPPHGLCLWEVGY